MSDKLTLWFPASTNPTRPGMYRVQDTTMRCGCCWITARWSGTEWFTNLHSPPGRYTTHFWDVKRWRGLAKKP